MHEYIIVEYPFMHEVANPYGLYTLWLKIGLLGKYWIIKPWINHFQGSKKLSSKQLFANSSLQIMHNPVNDETW